MRQNALNNSSNGNGRGARRGHGAPKFGWRRARGSAQRRSPAYRGRRLRHGGCELARVTRCHCACSRDLFKAALAVSMFDASPTGADNLPSTWLRYALLCSKILRNGPFFSARTGSRGSAHDPRIRREGGRGGRRRNGGRAGGREGGREGGRDGKEGRTDGKAHEGKAARAGT